MNLPIYVINLKTAQKRWTIVKNAGDQIDLNLIRIDAINGKLVPREQWLDIDRNEFQLNTARDIFPGEYGCYRSHILALETFINDGSEHAVILEDDIIPDGNLLDRIEAIISDTGSFDAVKLVNHRTSGFISLLTTTEGDEIGRTVFGPQGSAAAYLVSRTGAINLVKALKTMKLPWDVALERYWEIDTNILTVKVNILEFSAERSNSDIAPHGYGNKLSYIYYLRRSTIIIPDFFHRFFHGMRGPERIPSFVKQHPSDSSPTVIKMVFAALLFLTMASVFWVETDAYRYASLAILAPTCFFYFKQGMWRYDRPRIGMPGILCLFWAFYVLARYLYDFANYPLQSYGAAEGIYLFPFVYSTLGYAFWRYSRKLYPLVIAFLIISLAALLLSTDYTSIMTGVKATTSAHNNTIHAANASGFILIFSVCLLLHVSSSAKLPVRYNIATAIASIILFIISLINVLVLTSKGVWLSLAIAIPFLLVFSTFSFQTKISWPRIVVFIMFLGVLLAIFLHWYIDEIIITAGASFHIVIKLIGDVVTGEGLISSIENIILSSKVPSSALTRFQMWLDAISIWAKSPYFGVGVHWSDFWAQRVHSSHLSFNIFHNGYLEIGIRYGITGLLFFGFIFCWSVKQVFLASKYNLIAPAASVCFITMMIFFLLSAFTNSNIRLAFGESYMMLAVGFGFYCYYRLQETSVCSPKTII